jgi:mono/diheme cytochrome c family protein
MLVAVAPVLMAAMWMDRQPSYKPYDAPVLSPPVDSVPVGGREIISQDSVLKNPFNPTAESLARGKALYDINCALCHGATSLERGPVGKKLVPPPPGLDHGLVKERSDEHIYRAIMSGFGRMPAFGNKTAPQERWDLVNYLRSRT